MPRQPRLLTMFVLACALFLRVAVPAGWMPSTSGGELSIAPCASAAPAFAHAMDHGGASSHHDSTGKSHNGDCSFAPLQAGLTAAPDVPAVFVRAAHGEALPQAAVERLFARGPPAPPPPARGPPAIA